MKRIVLICAVLVLMITAFSCKKLDVPVNSQYVTSNFPQTSGDYTALVGTMYSNLSSNYAITYWRMQELSTDEAIIPARNGNFDDGGQYRLMHYHTWTIDHPYVSAIWQWGFTGINTCNNLINVTNSLSSLSAASKATNLAQIRAMRALYYFFMMDLYGNVPISTTYPVVGAPATQSRANVFKFIESELLAIKQQLPSKTNNLATNTVQYGTPTKGMVFALLEKMYLNAAVYTGTPRYTDAVAMADSVMSNPNYTLDAQYRNIFLPTNGPQVSETIFAIPYDQQIPGNQFTRFGFYAYLAPAYGIEVSFSIAMSTTLPFYASNFNLPGDFRNTTWLLGPQFVPNTATGAFTSTPAVYPGTTTQIIINPSLTLIPPLPMDLGDGIAQQAEGIRSIKYYPDPTATQATRLNGNDVPVFRLADVMLMKAEAILRGAPATAVNGVLQTPDYLVNQIRTRAGATTMSNGITLAGLLSERARELSWEGWRRNDLIRYGLFETYVSPFTNPSAEASESLTFNTDPTRELFPVPATEISLNHNLVQNPGY